jgi:hypothetical protein
MGYSVAGGKLIHEKKTRNKKSRDTVPLTYYVAFHFDAVPVSMSLDRASLTPERVSLVQKEPLWLPRKPSQLQKEPSMLQKNLHSSRKSLHGSR